MTLRAVDPMGKTTKNNLKRGNNNKNNNNKKMKNNKNNKRKKYNAERQPVKGKPKDKINYK